MIKVFLGGEGPNDIGRHSSDSTEHEPGVAETLLRRVRATGWQIEKTLHWKSIRKFRAGAGAKKPEHGDVRNVQGLAVHAYEDQCDVLVFLRDHDGDHPRGKAIREAVENLSTLGLAESFGYELAVVGGIPTPNLEGWMLCLLGHHATDNMTSARVEQLLPSRAKSTADYLEIAESKPLPTQPCSLRDWLDDADATFGRLIDGT